MTLKQALNICCDSRYHLQCLTKDAEGHYPPGITLDFSADADTFNRAMMQVFAYQKQPNKVETILNNKARGCLEIDFIITGKEGGKK